MSERGWWILKVLPNPNQYEIDDQVARVGYASNYLDAQMIVEDLCDRHPETAYYAERAYHDFGR